MPAQNLICLVVERLHAGMVGAYGNSWIRTAALDDLACESFLFDQAYVESPLLEPTYRALWYGVHAANKSTLLGPGGSLPSLLAAAGRHTTLLTDSQEVAALPGADRFAEPLFVDPFASSASAKDTSETGMARLFGAAAEWIRSAHEPFCLWVHARGMAGPWDAPIEMRNQFADEEDPTPPTLVDVPNQWLPDEFDPDEPLGIKHAYAGQVSLLDLCLGGFLEALDASPLAANTHLAFLSTSGFPLGEHRRIGACDHALYNETTQLVWLLRLADGRGKLARTQALVQPSDVPGTLLDCLGLPRDGLAGAHISSLMPVIRGESDRHRDRLWMVGPHDRALRTAAWHLREPITGAAELYAKPSDRWEVNEVANRLPEITLQMQAALHAFDDGGSSAERAPLDESLTEVVD